MVSLEQSFQSSSGFGERTAVYSSQKSIVQFSFILVMSLSLNQMKTIISRPLHLFPMLHSQSEATVHGGIICV